jgi:signal peptidase
MSIWAGTPFPIDLVTSDSMSPTLMEGDVVAWTPTDIEDLEVGDVIVFKSYLRWPDEKILVHRVNDIKTNSKGEFLLETKGDNNEWIDQAGPHIPEPYIREDHVMGKVISVGQFPLKIPFVGYLGVWVNDGLDLISQPASQKDSLSYVGIFAPLTVSAVIMVVLIFILPEKAKTIKEKIHLYVFGRRPLNLKRTLAMFLVSYVVFLTLIHAFAYDSVSASVGVGASSPDAHIEFGEIKQGTESLSRPLQILNPSTMPVKGIIYGRGEVSNLVERQTFEMQRGEARSELLQANAMNNPPNGSYLGQIMVYSSPFWLMFPNDFISDLVNWNPEATVFILDFLSALILTILTMLLLIAITFVGETLSIWMVDRSWRHPARLIIKQKTVKRFSRMKERAKRAIGKGIMWIGSVDIASKIQKDKNYSSLIKPVIASLFILPILFFIDDQITSMFLAVIIAGIFAYCLSCKLRNKIIITTFITMTLAIVNMMIQSNMIIVSKQQTMLELLTLSFGAIGIYLLVFSLLMIPLALVSWYITRIIRNVKERKDPLLSLEGSCDL